MDPRQAAEMKAARDAFRAAERKELPAGLRKELDTEVAKTDEGTHFRLSTGSVDRHGDTINQDGWDLKAYQKNPVVLFAHASFAPPVGKSLRTWVENKALNGVVKFTDKDEYEFGHTIGKLVAGGYLKAVSVGFRALEWEIAKDRDDGDSWFPPIDFKKQELTEYSVVPVPANAEALQGAKGAGIELRSYVGEMERLIATVKGEGVWLTREEAEQAKAALAAVSTRKTFVLSSESIKAITGEVLDEEFKKAQDRRRMLTGRLD